MNTRACKAPGMMVGGPTRDFLLLGRGGGRRLSAWRPLWPPQGGVWAPAETGHRRSVVVSPPVAGLEASHSVAVGMCGGDNDDKMANGGK